MTYPYRKPRLVGLKMESVKTHHRYAFNFNPIKQYSKNRFNRMINHLKDKVFKEGDSDIYYVLIYPEYSPTGRLHFHGYILIKDVFRFYSSVLPNLDDCGTYVIKEIEDEVLWHKYVTKQIDIWKVNVVHSLPTRLPANFAKDQPKKHGKDMFFIGGKERE